MANHTLLVVRELGGNSAVRPQPLGALLPAVYEDGRGRLDGPVDAPVRITVFSDYYCPAFGELNHTLGALRERRPDAVAVVHRHLPLTTLHPHAYAAAVAAECAGEQGTGLGGAFGRVERSDAHLASVEIQTRSRSGRSLDGTDTAEVDEEIAAD